MVLRRLWALILSALLVASLGGCSSSKDEQLKGGVAQGTAVRDSAEEAQVTAPDDGGEAASDAGTVLQASKSSDELLITRPEPGGRKPDGIEDGSWTVFCYFCGSDLESDLSAATFNLSQMVAATGSDKVSFVVETGGARQWEFEDLSAKENDRLFIQDGAVTVVDSVPAQNMGDAETLADFLTWGVENYPADHMGVILWNHGGGSVGGLCFDELYEDDALSLDEVDYAFGRAFASSMWDKFDFVGCDACLMSTLETANILASYADYYYASQEIEPSTGWDYTAIMEYLAANPDAEGAGLGRCVTDSYFENMEFYEVDDSSSTFAVTDLTRIDALLKAFNTYARDLFDKTEDTSELTSFMRGVASVDSFGGNNETEGYTNMVDLKGILNVSSDAVPSAKDVLDALDKAVIYHREGSDHQGVGGLSVYFPLQVSSADELSAFASVCVSPYYLSFVDRQAQGKVYGDAGGYSNDGIFSDDGMWYQHLGSQLATPGQGQDAGQYWSYADEGASDVADITFADEPQVTEDGTYWCRLDEASLQRASVVEALLYEQSADGKDFLAIGETFEVYVDWETGEIEDAFDGLWLSLPDGQNLCAYIDDWTDEYTVFTCPIELNGENTNLRLRVYDEDYSVVVEGVWDGISESGASGRGVRELKPGDVIKPLYDAFAAEGDDQSTYEGQEYKVDDDFYVVYDQLAAGDYYYEFSIGDLYGSYYITDPVIFTVDENGDIFFDF